MWYNIIAAYGRLFGIYVMFSQLGPLFKTHLRQAESTDARLAIRRDEKQDQGKKDDEAPTEDQTSSLWEDTTSVSVEALRTFLIEFLKTRGETVAESSVKDEVSAPSITPEERKPASPRAAAAVRAYSAMAGQTHYVPPTEEPAEEVDLVSLLKADEVRTIHILIDELDQLGRKGVQTLTIEKADTFLEALVQAVRAEKSKV